MSTVGEAQSWFLDFRSGPDRLESRIARTVDRALEPDQRLNEAEYLNLVSSLRAISESRRLSELNRSAQNELASELLADLRRRNESEFLDYLVEVRNAS